MPDPERAPATPPGALTPSLAVDIRRVFDAQRQTALRLRRSTVKERLGKLERLRESLLAHRDDILRAAARDLGRPAAETDLAELVPLLADLAGHRRHLRRWLQPRRVRPTALLFGTRAEVRREPRGRCLIIAPWNYPLVLTLGPLIPAVACGNTAILKTSELAPECSGVLARIVREVFEEDEVAPFEGDASVAEALLALPFDHMFFTGSPAIGSVVMSAAAKHLASVTLELGGKSPVVIDETADLALAVKTLAWTKFLNAGQTCIAPDHVYVHAAVYERVLELFKRRLDAWYGGAGVLEARDFGRIVNERHTLRLISLLEDARARGAQLPYGGEADAGRRFIAPTLLTQVPREARIMEEEIFGPLLPLIPYCSLEEVLERINGAPKPLAMYIWTRNRRTAQRLIENTSAGGTCVNHAAAQFLHHNLPFGGVNHSGIGSYHGEWGIRAFSHERAVLETRVMLARIFFPPYGARVQRLSGLLRRWLS